ncbi:MAG: pyridoxal phosphate-dependent aminotransferase [Planctomycetota bacterium]|nr:pyridoxal phosphate-dependent aminotransferase [Planctomycetota bacterium]
MRQPLDRFSERAGRFRESVIRGMSIEAAKYGALNLAQGFPDFPAPDALKQAACDAIMADVNQYAITWGDKALRAAIASKYDWHQGIQVDPETQLTVVCGATEAMIVALTAIINPGDEVIITQPFYENYWPDCVLTGATPRFVSVKPPLWRLDLNELESAFNEKTKALILCNPSNPTGTVLTSDEIQAVADLCKRHNTIVIMDEIYEHILYDGRKHISMAAVDGMDELAIVISGMSKTYAVTGWRIGTILASPELTKRMRQVHDFITIGAAAPLQRAGVVAYHFDQDYYTRLAEGYQRRRDFFCDALKQAGLPFNQPEGAYYVMADISSFGFANDREAALSLVRDAKVAGVPGSSFYLNQTGGDHWIRFCFCKREETLTAAAQKLIEFAGTRAAI